jgi:hypothetical protein
MAMFALLLALTAPTTSTKMPPAQALPPPSGEEQAVLNSANSLLAAFDTGNAVEILRWVYPDGRVTGTGTLPTRSGVRSESWTQFAQRASGSGFQETISDPAIEIDGDAAMIWAPFVVRISGKVYNCGIDHFDLVREQGTWKVMNLTFSSRVVGCPAE